MPSDEELMQAYVSGDAGAFRELFARYAPALHRIFSRHLRQPEAARDLVQQTFLQLHRARRDFDARQPLRPWLFTIALNLEREHLRRKRRRPEASLDFEQEARVASPLDAAARSEAASDVHKALESLPVEQREVIELHWFGGLSFQEVASVVGAGLAATKVRAFRGYCRLRELLTPGETAPSGNQSRKRTIL
jgi:RNA polymerase sigma-70 factor (ECF subfamily)